MKGGWKLRAIRLAVGAAERISPDLAARLMQVLWFSAPRTAPADDARACLETARTHVLELHGHPVVAWSWGTGPMVLLVHGWGGNSGQMCAFVAPLLEAGFGVVAFDAPAHGASGASRLGRQRVTFFEMAEALKAVAGMFPQVALVAHSGGCAAVALAMREGWEAPGRMAFIAPFAIPSDAVAGFAATIGASETVVERFRERAERWLGHAWSYFDIPNLPLGRKNRHLLVVHDVEDREVAFDQGRVIVDSWPQAGFLQTKGLGHRRVLAAPQVVAHVTAFLAEGASA